LPELQTSKCRQDVAGAILISIKGDSDSQNELDFLNADLISASLKACMAYAAWLTREREVEFQPA
jgi:hypothetical protein